MRRLLNSLILLAAAVAVYASGGGAIAKDKPVSWKMIDDALFRVNDAPVKD